MVLSDLGDVKNVTNYWYSCDSLPASPSGEKWGISRWRERERYGSEEERRKGKMAVNDLGDGKNVTNYWYSYISLPASRRSGRKRGISR